MDSVGEEERWRCDGAAGFMYAVLLLFPLSRGVSRCEMHAWGMYEKPFSRSFDAYHIPSYPDA